MYKRILLPVDGSRVSEAAACAGIDLARSLGAQVTALHVVPTPVLPAVDAYAHDDRDFESHLATALEKRGALYLETIRDNARKAGVPCDIRLVRGASPHERIIAESERGRFDVIVMGSHGSRGGDGSLLGGETIKVATLGTVPVLIHRVPG